jgi:hypothetical protein
MNLHSNWWANSPRRRPFGGGPTLLPRLGHLAREIWRRHEGAELVELVVVLPLLLILAFGILELGNALDKAHGMATLSREGANIAARGADLDEVTAVTMMNGVSIGLDTRGGTIVSRILVEGGVPIVQEQVASLGYAGLSHIGQVDSTVTGFLGSGLAEGQQVFAVEVFYDYQMVTPVAKLMAPIIPDTMYDAAVF